MATSRKVEDDGLIVTAFSGRHTYKDAVNALDELIELNTARREIYEIVINSDDIELVFTREEEKQLSEHIRKTFVHFDTGALAVVANSDLVFGLSRVLEVAIDSEMIPIAVFRSEALARKWIEEIRELHHQRLNMRRA